jgi:adenine-specific DNA methylase
MRTPCTCPKCGSAVEAEVVFKPRRQSAEARAAAKLAPAADLSVVAVVEGDDLEIIEDEDAEAVVDAKDEDDALMEDVADLGEDDDDMAEVMEHLDDEGMQGEV